MSMQHKGYICENGSTVGNLLRVLAVTKMCTVVRVYYSLFSTGSLNQLTFTTFS
jgi:hypothetical protein